MPTAIADLDKPISGSFQARQPYMPHLATGSRSSIQRTERRVRVIYHPGMRERTRGSEHSYPGNAGTVIYHDVTVRAENFGV
jgi:hypothetical protein